MERETRKMGQKISQSRIPFIIFGFFIFILAIQVKVVTTHDELLTGLKADRDRQGKQ